MHSYLENIGLMAICFVIIYGYNKLLEYNDMRWSSFYRNNNVYKAADKFVHGAASNDVKALLTRCVNIDKEDADEILSRSLPHRTDHD